MSSMTSVADIISTVAGDHLNRVIWRNIAYITGYNQSKKSAEVMSATLSMTSHAFESLWMATP